MKSATILALLTLLLTPLALAQWEPTDLDDIESHKTTEFDGIEGYNTTELEWEIEVDPHTGKTIVARGTVEQIREEALKHNPDWDAHYIEPARQRVKRALETGSYDELEAHFRSADLDLELDSDSESGSHLAKRKVFNLGALDCGGRWKEVYWDQALRSTAALSGLKGYPKRGAGPGNCGRVSCSYNTAIWWCNDEPFTKTLMGYDRIYYGAMEIVSPCSHTPFGGGRKTSGQAFSTGGWNVIVRKDKC
ncbi:hypothetical protein BJY00DRAFT_310778 [Aspergillus carlsbadensis]|nr:hypothetical protein BJY00DRAFT_310778 [Aspergillus carlsbadensis]